jgi:hypothetical protein
MANRKGNMTPEGREKLSQKAKAQNAKQREEMDPEERSEMMRRRVMLRWQKADPLRNTPTKDAIALVSLACSMGATVGRICEVLDISPKKFRRFMETSPEFAEAVKGGRQIEHDALVNKLVEVALSGNVAALALALKGRHNLVDSGVGHATLVENKVAITFQLPGALSPEKYLQTLSATAEIIRPEDVTRVLAQSGVKGKLLKKLAIEAASEVKTNGEE